MQRLVRAILLILFCGISPGSVYYVDDVTGNYRNSGIANSSPRKSLSKVYPFSFLQGNRILFRNGSKILNITSSNAQAEPEVYSNYGTGKLPEIKRESCVFVPGVVEIENLHLKNILITHSRKIHTNLENDPVEIITN